MTLHAITKYIKYRWKAKDRHGVHSPFAYSLNELVLHNAKGHETPEYSWLPKRYNMLMGKLLDYYGYTTVLMLPPADENEQTNCDVMMMKGDAPGEWVLLFNRYHHLLNDSSMVVITGIHRTKRHTQKWRRLHAHPKVRMSVDLYGVGLLFFREDFKEKQHFILKY